MAYPSFRTTYPPAPPPFRITRFRGVNLSVTATQIDNAESPDMPNMQLDEIGLPEKRTGYVRLWPTSLGPGQVNGMHEFKKADGSVVFLVNHGTKLYTQAGSDQPVELYTGMADAKSKSFVMNGKMYLMDGTNYLVLDGATVQDVSTVAYVPTLTISRPPTGGGTALDQWNLLTPYFKDSFSGNGTDKVYQLSQTNLDATPIVASIDGGVTFNKVETTDFTVNRATGAVTWITAPPNGTNNVIIKAAKTQSGFADRIKKCKLFVIYGGNNDTRVFWAGNPDLPNWMWRSGLYDPTYAPENQFQKVGSDASAITGFAKQYVSCLILKAPSPHDTVVWNMNYQLSADGTTASFPVVPLNDEIGCSSPDSIQLIDNMPAYLNAQKGVYFISGTNVKDERNAQHMSDKVDPRLLTETDLQNAVSVDFEKKYMLAVGSIVYVYDYRQQEWYIWDNIPASCFLVRDRNLYFGSNSEGLVFRFKKPTEAFAYNDDGAAIIGYWKSKIFSYDADEFLKMVEKVFFSLKPGTKTSADLYYITDKVQSEKIATARMDLFDFSMLDFGSLTFITSALPQETAAKIKAKKIIYFQMILRNENIDESMGILSVGMKVHMQKEVK